MNSYVIYCMHIEACSMSKLMCPLGMSQQSDPGFNGATTPQSPIMSPRMAHTQSPMMQQSQATPAYQSTDMNGWTQSSNGGNR